MAIVPSAGSLRGSDWLVAVLLFDGFSRLRFAARGHSDRRSDLSDSGLPPMVDSLRQPISSLVLRRTRRRLDRARERYRRPVYDSLCSVLAAAVGGQVVTTARRLYNGVYGGPLDHLVLWATDPLCR